MAYRKFFALLLSVSAGVAWAEIPKFFRVNERLYRGGQPEERSDYEDLRRIGVKTVINLRTTPEEILREARIVNSLGMNFISYPIDGSTYPEKRVINSVLMDFHDPELTPIFIHCFAGQDRTGLVIGLHRVYSYRWRPADAYREMLKFNFLEIPGLKKYFWDNVHN